MSASYDEGKFERVRFGQVGDAVFGVRDGEAGAMKIEWAESHMPVLMALQERRDLLALLALVLPMLLLVLQCLLAARMVQIHLHFLNHCLDEMPTCVAKS